jgi:hypothetical protein
MRASNVAFVVACLLAAIAAVAIVGVPTTSGDDGGSFAITTASSVAPAPATAVATTSAATTTLPATSVAASTPPSAPATSAAPTTEPDTTVPDTTAPQSTAPDTTAPPTTAPPEARDRADLIVAAVNASDVGGVAGEHADELEAIGYVDVGAVDAIDPSAVSGVFYAAGLELEALRLREDLGWIPSDVLSQDLMPELDTDSTFDLVVVIGRDRAGPPPAPTDTEP